jgi:diguanylate cyclase (GGDEF)-like protein
MPVITYGHPAGDLVLIQLSQLLKENIRKSDSLCRLGGEEFIILLPDTSEGKAAAVAEKLRQLIENHIFVAGDKPVRISASFGIASLDYSEDPRLINQYSKVDHALYIAKQNGRNQVIAV